MTHHPPLCPGGLCLSLSQTLLSPPSLSTIRALPRHQREPLATQVRLCHCKVHGPEASGSWLPSGLICAPCSLPLSFHLILTLRSSDALTPSSRLLSFSEPLCLPFPLVPQASPSFTGLLAQLTGGPFALLHHPHRVPRADLLLDGRFFVACLPSRMSVPPPELGIPRCCPSP